MNGSRRPAIIWADNLSYKYDEQNAHFSLSFELIKGAYATNFLREVLGRDDIFNLVCLDCEWGNICHKK